ncbi:MAG: protein kinase, partial [Gemmatimonadetes bacterium]|nr:protein kinase [Gemmatimonadota bacterium]
NLQHPNILPLYDSGGAGTYLYYVMPYVEGESLRDKLTREKQLAVEETVDLAKGVAAALQFAHEHSVIHRDIKPENILLQSGQPVVADFGIALAISQASGTRLTETGLSLGTPHYMSPEQASGDRQLDARTDIYSLGAMVYEMLTGDPPHSGNTVQAVVAKILTESPSPISRTRSLVPHNAEAAVEKALAKAPADRFTSAAKFADALVNPAFTLPHMVTMARPVPIVGGSWQRLSIGLAVWGAVATVAALWGWLRHEASRQVSRYSVALPEAEALAAVAEHRIAISRDGQRIVYVGPADQGSRLWLRTRDQLHATPLPGTEGAVNPFFSPDGSRVGFVTATSPRAVKVISLAGGPPTTLTDSLVDLGGASWGSDGYIYFDAHLEGDGFARVAETGGLPEPVTMPVAAKGEAWHAQPDALPNRRGVLFAVSHGGDLREFDIAVVDLAARAHRVLARGLTPRYASSGHVLYVTADGTLMAAPFDQDDLSLAGEPVALVEGLGVRGGGRADLNVSTDGTLIYTTGASTVGPRPRELVWVARDGKVTPIDPGWPGVFSSVALSPDGTQLAIGVVRDNETHVWIKQLDRGPASKLTFGGSYNDRPAWTSDGRAVAFISDSGQNWDLFAGRADGSVLPQLLRDESGNIREAEYSRDGKWLVHRSEFDLYAARTDGDTARTPLVTGQFIELTPRLSPDGRWLAYSSDESGRREVYIRPFPNTQSAKRQVSTSGGAEPLWSRSGRELFYKNGNMELVSAAVLPGTTFTVGEQRVLFSTAEYQNAGGWQVYDITPDGRRFVMIRPIGGPQQARDELIVVENFFEELKAKAKRTRD